MLVPQIFVICKSMQRIPAANIQTRQNNYKEINKKQMKPKYTVEPD